MEMGQAASVQATGAPAAGTAFQTVCWREPVRRRRRAGGPPLPARDN